MTGGRTDAHRMQNAALGLLFQETLSGHFALGQTDPEAGGQIGERAGHTLSVRALVHIADMTRFVSDPDYAAAVSGQIDLPALGKSVSILAGAFSLPCAPWPNLARQIFYVLPLEHAGKDYTLIGRQAIPKAPGLDPWRETTMLPVRLHEGQGGEGRVLGAGILRASMTERMNLASTLRVLHPQSSEEERRTLLRFGAFFLGELWNRCAGASAPSAPGGRAASLVECI